jgi:hypothetical protein
MLCNPEGKRRGSAGGEIVIGNRFETLLINRLFCSPQTPNERFRDESAVSFVMPGKMLDESWARSSTSRVLDALSLVFRW